MKMMKKNLKWQLFKHRKFVLVFDLHTVQDKSENWYLQDSMGGLDLMSVNPKKIIVKFPLGKLEVSTI